MIKENPSDNNQARQDAKKIRMNRYCKSSILFFVGFMAVIIIGLYGVWFLESIIIGIAAFIICFLLVISGAMSTAKYCTIRRELKKGKPS
jgi:hypothetical protein